MLISSICSFTNELKACDPSWVINMSNIMDLGTGNYQMDVEVCVGDGGSENGFSTTFSGLNVVSFTPPNLTEGGNIAVGSATANVLDYAYPGDGASGDVFVAQYTNSCFNYTVVLDGDPSGTDVVFDGINCQSANCPGSCAFVGGGTAIVPAPTAVNDDLSCGDIFTDGTGNYANNADDGYLICPADPNEPITLTFTSFNLETSYDFLTIYDGDDGSATSLGTFTGNLDAANTPPPPGPFTSTAASGCLFAYFESDGSFTNPGWEADITCGAEIIIVNCDDTFTDGVGNYSNDLADNYYICPTNAGELVTLTFTTFDIENGSDNITIYDGNNDSATSLGTFSGTSIPGPFTSTAASGCLFVTFTSDAAGNSVGWEADVDCSPPITHVCDDIFTDGAGTYSSNSNDRYYICPTDPDDAIVLTFTLFDIESGFDFMTIYDGDGDFATSLGTFTGTFTGANIPGPFVSTAASGCLYIIFDSDSSVNYTGWEANVDCDDCGGAASAFVR